MPILILGGRGNLGSQLAAVLADDHQVLAWDREDLDVLDFPKLRTQLMTLRPEIIINTVAYNAVDKCEDKTEYPIALKLNRDLPGYLADIALELDATLVHYSSDYVFNGTEEKREFFETDTPNPLNKYGESKFLGEQEILRRGSSGLNYYLIRTSKLFGPRGTSPAAKPSFFDIMLDLAQDKKELTVVKEELSCFTYTPDLAAGTAKLIASDALFGIYHLVNEGPCTWYDGAVELFKLNKIKLEIRPIRSENLARAARRPKFSVLKNTRARRLRHWREALKEYKDSLSN